MAELGLSWPDERENSGNPFLCMVQDGTLQLLSDIPELWNIPVFGPESARKITMAARIAIDEQIEQEYARLDKEAARAEAHRHDLERELAGVQAALQSERSRLDSISIQVLQEMQNMEDQFRRIDELLAEKRERLIALDLIDASDLQLPSFQVDASSNP